MRLPIGPGDFAAGIDKNLRIVNDIAFAFRHSAHDRKREFFRHALKRRHRAFRPRLRVLADD